MAAQRPAVQLPGTGGRDPQHALRVLLDGAPVMVWASGTDARCNFLNKPWLDFTGRTMEQELGEGWTEGVHPEDYDRVMADYLRAFHAREPFCLEYRLRRRDGQYRTILDNGTPWVGELGDFIGYVGSCIDITEVREAEQERTRLESKMQEVQRLEGLGVLAEGIAHDFSQLLSVMLGNSRLILDELDPNSQLGRRLGRIRTAAQYAAGLTEQMLDYSGNAPVRLEPLDLARLAADMAELLGAPVSENCRLETDFGAGVAPVDGDPTRIRQVILNLMTNASEALEGRKGVVRMRTGSLRANASQLRHSFGTPDPPPGDYVYLEVSDTGTGIPSHLRGRLFDPSFTTKLSGRGLGLAAVLGIVRAHRGLIKVASTPGDGTTFRVLFPRSARMPKSVRAAPQPVRELDGGATVLVVDDEEAVLEITREFLARSGFRVICALGGREAVEVFLARGSEIDAVVLDLVMPEMGGEETFLALRKVRPNARVVLASGYSEESAAKRFPAKGIAAFLRKPYEPEELVEKVRTALRR